MADADKLGLLRSHRKSLKSSLTRFNTYLDEVNSGLKSNDQLRARFGKIENALSEYNNIQGEIEFLIGDNDLNEIDANDQDREFFENKYFEVIQRAQSMLNNQVNLSLPQQQIQTNKHLIKLEPIKLPEFDGTYEKWIPFKDVFESLIHNDASMPLVIKFHHLKSCLRGKAKLIIESLEVVTENYLIAWDLLKDRFENKTLIIHNHIKKLVTATSLTRESAVELRNLLDTYITNLRSLKSLNQGIEHWDQFLIYLLLSKLDAQTIREWEGKNHKNTLPKFDTLMEFLKERCQVLEKLASAKADKFDKQKPSKSFVVAEKRCGICQEPHTLYNCPKFLKLVPTQRIVEVKKLNLCLNCLRNNHFLSQCKSPVNCKICKRKHNTLLHVHSNTPETSNANDQGNNSNTTTTMLSTEQSEVLMATVLIKIKDSNNEYQTCRALLDSASQSNYLTQKLANSLNLKLNKKHSSIVGFGNNNSDSYHEADIIFQSNRGNYKRAITCKVVPHITGELPSMNINTSNLKIPQNIHLADPSFYKPGEIDILLGTSIFFNSLSIGQIKLSKDAQLQKTQFGWVVTGPINIQGTSKTHAFFTMNKISVEDQLEKFWKIEGFNDNKLSDNIEHPCETHFKQTASRTTNGQFKVNILLKNDIHLGNSYDIAKARLLSTERRLSKNETLKKQYIDFMNEYKQLGHMTKLNIIDSSVVAYYLPHHPVIKEDSLTTKVRVVFDGSCPSDNGISFNQLQHVGPTVQQELFSILLRFRKYPIAITSDVEKMYRMVLIDESQRDLQRILWREDPSQPIETYQLNTVTYGTTAAPFLAIRSLYELSFKTNKQDLARIIQQGFYVDDLLTGAYTISGAIDTCIALSNLLNTAKFKLRKWASNSKQLLQKISGNSVDQKIIRVYENPATKTLGIEWNTDTDMFQYSIKPFGHDTMVTKRNILSYIAQIYDPLGLLSPVTIVAKCIMQKLWEQNYTWDESVSHNLYTEWLQFINEFNLLNSIHIPRFALSKNLNRVELHGFCDSSETAYGACIYIKSINYADQVTTNLLCAKTRVAPLHKITIPRLELCAAVLLSELISKVSQSLRINFDNTVLWSDSTIVLNWINAPVHKLLPFVGNRVAKILSNTKPEQWHHVRSQENPADLLTRGINPLKLQQLSLWWKGPHWLQCNNNEMYSQHFNPSCDIYDLPEVKKTQITLATLNQEFPIDFNNYSDITRLQRVIAFVFRFINNIKRNSNIINGPLSVQELDISLNYIIKQIQAESFHTDIKSLKQGKAVSKEGKLLSLNPFLDSQNVLRVGGRLTYSNLNYNQRHPIILPRGHHVTKLIFEKYHCIYYHAGPQLLLSLIRNRFWPIGGRSTAKYIIHKCIRCVKANPKLESPIMGNLPVERITPSSPFTNTGVDYAGPFLIKDKKTRGCKLIKAYVCIFICLVTKAIHIELVSDLSADCFLAALRRFSARRGKPHSIYSDNATNFVKANKDLAQFLNSINNDIIDQIHNLGIQWNFIPPRSPNFGGLWEASIKGIKRHLLHCNTNAMVYEDFITVLTQIEALLNSRPLSPLSSDPEDLSPLTPAHFLVGKSLVMPAEPLINDNINQLNRFQKIQQAVQQYWKRWSVEYIHTLQQRYRWQKNPNCQLSVGSLVLVKDDNLPPLRWKLGRVLTLHPGRDNVVRVANIKTATGEVKRAVNKLCVLPVNV